MKSVGKKILKQCGLFDFACYAAPRLLRLKNRLLRADERIIRDYLATERAKKLQIGTGNNIRPGWLNSDYYSWHRGVIHLDARKRFPLPDACLDIVFSEHMIEHIPFTAVRSMFGECFRTLKPGGRIRIGTPDLGFLIDLYREDKSDLQRRYVEWAVEKYLPEAPAAYDTFVINNFVRDWGHLFIWDEKTLRRALEDAGFVDIARKALGRSDCEELRSLENEERMPEGFLALESLTVEARKPLTS